LTLPQQNLQPVMTLPQQNLRPVLTLPQQNLQRVMHPMHTGGNNVRALH
jgi:hypothetical protein